METPQKRLFDEIDPDSSPEFQALKRPMGEMEAITKAIQDIQNRLDTVEELKHLALDSKETLTQIKGSLESINIRVTGTECKLKQLTLENNHLKKRVSLLEERSIQQEAYYRRDNLIIDGIPYQADENIESKVREIFRVNLKVATADSMFFTRIHRLSNTRKTIIRFHWYKDREGVWAQRRQLKGSGLWMEEDFPAEWKNKRQVLYPVMKIARKIPDVKATLSKDKLIINSQIYTVDNLASLPPAVELKDVLHIHEDNVFFGSKSSPLSNFYPAPFTNKGISYNCAEQFYQEMKAEVNHDDKAADDIRLMSDPVAMYRRGREVKADPNIWTTGKRLEVMEKALLLKFSQNSHLSKVLLSTCDKTIWEARSQDTFFGAGIGLQDIKHSNLSDAPGLNHLGQLLMKVRDILKAQEPY